MYTPIIPSIIHSGKPGIGLTFDLSAFEDLLIFSIISVHREINAFNRSRKNVAGSRYTLMTKIGVGMEIVKHAMYLNAIDKEIKFSDETKKEIKKLVLKVNNLIHKLGMHDPDFCSDSNTERALTTKEAIEFIKKKW